MADQNNPKIEAMIAEIQKANPNRTREDILAELKAWGVEQDSDLSPPQTLA